VFNTNTGALSEARERFLNVDDILVNGDKDRWTFQSILDVMSAWPSLRTFGIEHMPRLLHHTDVMPTEIPHNSIEVLILNAVDRYLLSFMDQAIAANVFASVNTLYYTSDATHCYFDLETFFRRYGPNIVELHMGNLIAINGFLQVGKLSSFILIEVGLGSNLIGRSLRGNRGAYKRPQR